MIPQRILVILTYALPLLVVVFAVLMGGAALAQATQDNTGASVLRWIASGMLLLVVTDLVLLVGALGINAVHDDRDRPER